jgi:hypothetical protein
MAKKKQLKAEAEGRTLRKAQQLVSSPRFLYKVGQTIRRLGVIGERNIRLTVFLAGLTMYFVEKASVLIKGSTSSGKSTVARQTLQIFPPGCVIERAGLSKTALAYGRGGLGNKILLMTEYHSAHDAQFLLRLMQSEGHITHEATIVKGRRRKTKTVKRTGTPVVITTTTSAQVHPDDETRFQSVHMTETPKQNRRIVRAQTEGKQLFDSSELKVWRTAITLLKPQSRDFETNPDWLRYVAEHLPLEKVRVRRDWKRFLALLRAVALCRPRPENGQPLEIAFSDYCVAYKIFEPVLVASIHRAHNPELPQQQLELMKAIEQLHEKTGDAISIRDLVKRLRWTKKRVYKEVQRAVKNRTIRSEAVTREKNVKRFLPNNTKTEHFLPRPKQVLKNNPAIGKEVKYVHPFTGRWRVVGGSKISTKKG